MIQDQKAAIALRDVLTERGWKKTNRHEMEVWLGKCFWHHEEIPSCICIVEAGTFHCFSCSKDWSMPNVMDILRGVSR